VKYHDYRLNGYEVSDGGTRLTLHLVYDYAGKPRDESYIEFANVSLYHFVHTGGAIVTDVEETSLDDLLEELSESLPKWHVAQGLSGWRSSPEQYRQYLDERHCKAWRIESAIGFYGIVFAESVAQVTPNNRLERSRAASSVS
jgi:hypothetical protein